MIRGQDGDSGLSAVVRRAPVTEARSAAEIVTEAAAWAAARGIAVWDPEEIPTAFFEAAAQVGELLVGYEGGVPVATMLLQSADPVYWPAAAPGSALYLHKVAVRRAVAGRDWLSRLIAFAETDARDRGIPSLRLDTILRPKLRAMYERHGFHTIEEEPLRHRGRSMIRMEKQL